MAEQLEEVKGDIDDIQDKMKANMEEEKRLMIESQKKTLTFENLPKNVKEDQVQVLLTHYQGVKEVFVNPETWVAVVEFETHASAELAQKGKLSVSYNIGVNGYEWVPGNKLAVNFK